MPTPDSSRRTSTDRNPAEKGGGSLAGLQPFGSAEDAWLWTMAALRARRDGATYTANRGQTSRPCEADDVIRCLHALYRNRRIGLGHARILRIWGERQAPPNPAFATERHDFHMW